MSKMQHIKSVFFGTPEFSVIVLNELKAQGFIPTLIVTAPDKPKGRGLELAPTPVKEWAEVEGVDYVQPVTLKDGVLAEELANTEWDLFIVAAYGKIITKEILDLPAHGTLNVHPSLLPKLRGPSPVRSAILEDERQTGISIMLLDEETDHGPIIGQASVAVEEWPPYGSMLEKLLASEGGKLLAEAIPLWLAGKITPEEQDHSKATFTKKIEKEDARINLADDPYQNLLKIRALDDSPGAYFFTEKKGKEIRVKITAASLEDGELQIERVVPEGKREMPYEDFLRADK